MTDLLSLNPKFSPGVLHGSSVCYVSGKQANLNETGAVSETGRVLIEAGRRILIKAGRRLSLGALLLVGGAVGQPWDAGSRTTSACACACACAVHIKIKNLKNHRLVHIWPSFLAILNTFVIIIIRTSFSSTRKAQPRKYESNHNHKNQFFQHAQGTAPKVRK